MNRLSSTVPVDKSFVLLVLASFIYWVGVIFIFKVIKNSILKYEEENFQRIDMTLMKYMQ